MTGNIRASILPNDVSILPNDVTLRPCLSHVSATLRQLFPASVIVIERQAPGSLADLLPVEEQHVARARPKRRQEFAAGRSCARTALALLGVEPTVIPAAGDRQPIWPLGIAGSITHTAGFCAAAVARQAQVRWLGLDTEVIGAPTPEVWTTLCRADELAWIHALPAAKWHAAVTLVFSAKEAFYKCQYPATAEWLDFHDLRIDLPSADLSAGEFMVTPMRKINFAPETGLPAGRFAFHPPFVSTAVSVERR